MWKLGEIHGRAAEVEAPFQTSETVLMPIELSHDLHVSCVNVLMHIDMFSGM